MDLYIKVLYTLIILMKIDVKKVKSFGLLCLSITLLVSLTPFAYSSFDTPGNKTLIQPQGEQNMSTNATNIILVHGGWADGSGWSKEIPILIEGGHRVIAVQLPTHSLSDDVETVKRAVALVGGPTILVGHSYGGEVITNAGYNNPNVTGLVYIAAFAPDEGQSLSSFVDSSKFPKDLFIVDSGGSYCLNPEFSKNHFSLFSFC